MGIQRNAPVVRPANEGDVPIVYRMLRESAAEQGGEENLCVDPVNLLEDGFRRDPPRFQCLIAEIGGQPAGLALYFFVYSTWTSRLAVYLEDLFVIPALRRQGVARALMAKLANIADGAGCLHARWLVMRDNVAAIKFYEDLGAEQALEWSPMRIEHEGLKRLARSDKD